MLMLILYNYGLHVAYLCAALITSQDIVTFTFKYQCLVEKFSQYLIIFMYE